MEVNLQILFFANIIILQIVLVVTVIKDFKIFQETVNLMKQEGLTGGTHGHRKHEIENKNGTGKYAVEKEKQVEDLYKISEEGEPLFIRQVKLSKNDPITELNIVTDKGER
ncbi:MAG: hypothetical protein WBI21_03095 [Natronincolaceae bacterium]|nr:hypothetical protein [Bacillota bacterium]